MDWSFDNWPSGEPYEWMGNPRAAEDARDFHVDLGCGRVKKGRIGVDRYAAPGVNVICDLGTLRTYEWCQAPGEDATLPVVPEWAERHVSCKGLPFASGSIESIITHHALEHIGPGFIPLMDECYRVLKPDGVLRAIVPLFPSTTAVEDPDHCRYFMDRTFDAFCGTPGETPQNCWLASFSVPYTRSRFLLVDKDLSPPTPAALQWTDEDRREMRVTLKAIKPTMAL